MTSQPTVRTATTDELAAVMNVIDGGLLALSSDTVRSRIEDTAVLVAVDDDRIVGVLVRDGSLIEAIAVRPNRRGQSIGSQLIRAAGRTRTLRARFRHDLRTFYEQNDFEIESAERRLRGTRPAAQ